MAIHKLTPRKVSTADPGKYEDGGGLRLVVSNAGAKKWVLRFTIDGKRREMRLGIGPSVSDPNYPPHQRGAESAVE